MTKDEKLLAEARKRFDKASEAERKQRELAQEDLCFVGGEQWPDQIKNARVATDRPCLTINRLPQFTQQVIGDARQNKPGIKVSPVDDHADIEVAEVYEGLIRNIEAQSRATQAYISGLERAVEGAFGHWRVLTEYSSDDSFEQDIRIKRIKDPFAVFWDPAAREYDKSDAMWCFVSDWLDKDTFSAKYPKQTPSDWLSDYRGLTCHEEWVTDSRVRVVEYWVKKPIEKEIALLADGRVVDYMEGMRAVKIRKVKTHKVCRYLLSGAAVLEEEREFPCKYIPIVSVYGPDQYVDGQFIARSLVRHSKDPQRMYNFWQTAITEKIALAPKSPFLATPRMITGYEQEWNAANRENRAVLLYNPDPEAPGGYPQRQEPAAVNAAEMQQSAQSVDDLKATMGMYDASLGNTGNEQSGKAIMARQREGDTASFSWIDNLAWSIQHTGRILLDMIPRIYDTERVVRVLGADDTPEMVKINTWDEGSQRFVYDLSVGKYDVSVSAGPSYATKRQEASDSMLAFIQAYPDAGPIIGDLIAKNQDWPGADDIAERLKKALPPQFQEDDQDDPEAMVANLMSQLQEAHGQMQMMQEELEKHQQAEAMLKAANAEAAQAKAERTRFETQRDAAKFDVELEAGHLGNDKTVMETRKIAADIGQTVVNTERTAREPVNDSSSE